MGQILTAGEESQERAPRPGPVIADRPAQHRICRLERVQDRTLCDLPFNLQLDIPVDVRERSEMSRKHNRDHDSV
jgi:hypothetical protein